MNDIRDTFIDDCLKIEFQETFDERKWHEIPECKAVVEAGNSGKIEEALHLVIALRDKYRDFWFPYYWFALLYRKQGRYDKAIEALYEGLRFTKSKYALCAMMGTTIWETGNLPNAVKWWIRAIIIQIAANEIRDDEPFLELSYVAEYIGLPIACLRLRRHLDLINSSRPRLLAYPASKLYDATRLQRTESMKRAIEILDQRYLGRYLSIPTIEDFIENVTSGGLTAEGLIRISEFQILYDRLVEDLKKKGLSDLQVSDTLWNSFSGKCPKCGIIIDGPKLTAFGQLGHSNSRFASSARATPMATRFQQGLCPNEKCTSREIIILWRI